MSNASSKSTISQTFAEAVQNLPKLNKWCEMVFSITYKKSAVGFENLSEQEPFLCFEPMSHRRVTHFESLGVFDSALIYIKINLMTQREEFTDNEGFEPDIHGRTFVHQSTRPPPSTFRIFVWFFVQIRP